MSRPFFVGAILAFHVAAPGAGAGAGEGRAELAFARDGEVVARLSLAELRASCTTGRVEVDDPYYARRMAFHALPLACVLERGFGAPMAELAGEDFSLRALDGYRRPTTGSQLAESGAWLAFGDATLSPPEAPRFAPIDRRQVDPAPFYLVWTGEGRNDPHRHPWPYQLATIDRVPFERRHPHTVPVGTAPDSRARAGFALFRRECIMCHSINDEGGKVGPELNVPQSIVEYRPVDQIKAYVRDPARFRYTTMPAHPHLGDSELDALIAYFRAMSERKHDPRRSDGAD